MGIRHYRIDPLSLLFKNAFETSNAFTTLANDTNTGYPVNVSYNEEFLIFEMPVLRGNLNDIEITKTSDELRVKYNRSDKSDDGRTYIKKGITERDFDLVWKISTKYDTSKISSTYENGLLSIFIPFAQEAKPEKVEVINVNDNWKKVAQNQPLSE